MRMNKIFYSLPAVIALEGTHFPVLGVLSYSFSIYSVLFLDAVQSKLKVICQISDIELMSSLKSLFFAP